jgi:RNA polymerase sigma factor (sigma-70 family)
MDRRRSLLHVNDLQQAQIAELNREVQANQPKLAGFARGVLNHLGRASTRDLEDVVVDAYLTAVTRLRNDETLRVQNMAGWFRRIIFFTCLERRRRQERDERTFLSQFEEEDDVLDLVAGEYPTYELGAALREALENLPEKDRQIVDMSAAGYTSDEIAEKQGSNAEAIRQQKSRVLATLKTMLGGIQIWARRQ